MDRLRLLLGARLLEHWRAAIVVVQPDTLIRWHRGVQSHRGGGQTWATFLRNHADRTWACDFIQRYDLLFRQVYAFFIIHVSSRRVIHVAATRNPTQAWTAQQLRNALMTSDPPAILLRDRDDKFGLSFDDVAKGAGTRVIKIAVRSPNMNAIAERFVGSARRELLDHVMLLGDEQLGSLLREYRDYGSESRPHQGLGQRRPAGRTCDADVSKPIVFRTVLGGLHVDYRRAA
jgi:putative transposase